MSTQTNSAADCIFCKIIQGVIPALKIAENAEFVCIPDARPQAKKHLLVMPRHHVASLEAVFAPGSDPAQGSGVVGRLFAFADQVARQEGLLPAGFRSVINTGKEGGQTVFHLHLHLLGGESLDEAL
ncbi:MAG: HIT domain-containing protein [Methylotenera sp.]|nr:HIT domain-containing protein [Oligoflexia bacterium]